jgi:pilus assembly protein Flp/PilA
MRALIPTYVKLRSRIESTLDNEKGATMVEYALLAALIAAALVGAITALSGGISGTFAKVTGAL